MHEGNPQESFVPTPEDTTTGLTLSELLQEVTDDPELISFFSKTENEPLNPDGTSTLARDPFQLISDLAFHDEEKAHRLVDLLADAGFLPELHYEYQSHNLSTEELTHKLNLNRFDSARENFYKPEASPLEKAMVNRSVEFLTSVRESFGLKPLYHVEQYVNLKTEPQDTRDEGFGITTPETPIVIVNTPDDISSLKFTFHELTHIHAYSVCSFSKDEDGDIHSSFPNIGLTSFVNIDEQGNRARIFTGLNEAVTEEFSKQYIQSLQDDDPDFGELTKIQKNRILKYQETHPNELSPEEWSDVVAIHELPDGTEYPVQYTYREERLMMRNMLTEIAHRLTKPEDVTGAFQEFQEKLFQTLIQAIFTGNLSDFKNAFTEAFGEEAYERYSSCTTREDEAIVLRDIGVPGLEALFENNPKST